MKKFYSLLLTLIFLFTIAPPVFALAYRDYTPGEPIPDQNINIRVNLETGELAGISYIISSTGATSGIRYRTSAITVRIGGQTAVIDISSLGGTPSGVRQYTQISITKQDIISILPDLDPALLYDVTNIQIGAHIQIYNAASGQVLANITSRSEVARVAGPIGFGAQDIRDMESRFLEDGLPPAVVNNPVVIEEPHPPYPGDPNNGLRPSIIVK